MGITVDVSMNNLEFVTKQIKNKEVLPVCNDKTLGMQFSSAEDVLESVDTLKLNFSFVDILNVIKHGISDKQMQAVEDLGEIMLKPLPLNEVLKISTKTCIDNFITNAPSVVNGTVITKRMLDYLANSKKMFKTEEEIKDIFKECNMNEPEYFEFSKIKDVKNIINMDYISKAGNSYYEMLNTSMSKNIQIDGLTSDVYFVINFSERLKTVWITLLFGESQYNDYLSRKTEEDYIVMKKTFDFSKINKDEKPTQKQINSKLYRLDNIMYNYISFNINSKESSYMFYTNFYKQAKAFIEKYGYKNTLEAVKKMCPEYIEDTKKEVYVGNIGGLRVFFIAEPEDEQPRSAFVRNFKKEAKIIIEPAYINIYWKTFVKNTMNNFINSLVEATGSDEYAKWDRFLYFSDSFLKGEVEEDKIDTANSPDKVRIPAAITEDGNISIQKGELNALL